MHAGNRPKLELTSAKNSEIDLDLAKNSGIDADKEMHMHSLKLFMPDANTLRQEWTGRKEIKRPGIQSRPFVFVEPRFRGNDICYEMEPL